MAQTSYVWFSLLFSAAAICGGAEVGAATPANGEQSPALESAIVPGASASGNYLAGRFAQRNDDWSSAWHLMAAALDEDEENTELVRQGFLSATGAGRSAEALELAHRIVGFDPQNYFATTLLVAEEFATGDFGQAKDRLLAMSSRGANRLLVPLLMAWVDAGLGQGEAAVAALKSQAASNPLLLLHAALISDHLGNEQEAAALAEQLVEATRVPGRTARQIASIYERAGEPQKARALYERWAESGPDIIMGELALERMTRGEPPAPPVAQVKDGAAEAFLDLAAALRQENANDLALLYAQVAAYLRPDLAATQLLIGDVLADSRRHDDAIRHFSQVPRTSDLWWVTQLRIADTLARIERGDEANALLESLASDFPERTEALVLMGDLYRRGKRFEEAVGVYDRALDRVKDVHQRHWPLFYARGVALERTGRWDEAERDLLKALELQPNQPQVLNYLGYSWADKGINLDRAHDMLQHAVKLRPNDGHITDSLGWVLYRMGRHDEAVAKLERAVELEPREAEVNEHLGDVYWQVGRRIEARFQWLRALQQTTDDKIASAIQEKLDHGLGAGRKTAESGASPR